MQREFIFTDKWLDLVFENRNQSYGAYVLRKRLPRNILIGYMTALALMGTLVFTIYQFSAISIDKIKSVIDDLPTQIIYEIKSVTPPLPPETKPEIKNPPPKPSAENIIPVARDSFEVSETKDDVLKSENTSNSKDTSGVGDIRNDSSLNGSEIKESPESKEPLPTYMADKIPEFPGGEAAMTKFIQKNTHVPGEYLDEEISKTVYISFIVDSTGKVYEIKSEKNYDDYPKLSEEAKKTVTKMPHWIPGQQHGRNVSVRMTLPVKFSVKKDF